MIGVVRGRLVVSKGGATKEKEYRLRMRMRRMMVMMSV